ncbi:MAG: hypothetical protein ACRC9N_10965, partial [Aeromonas sp.]
MATHLPHAGHFRPSSFLPPRPLRLANQPNRIIPLPMAAATPHTLCFNQSLMAFNQSKPMMHTRSEQMADYMSERLAFFTFLTCCSALLGLLTGMSGQQA